MSTEMVSPEAWPAAKGYTNGRIGHGNVLHVAGQVGWNAQGQFVVKDLVGQFAQALDNVITVVTAAHGHVNDIAEMTIYVTDIVAYRAARKELGPVWKAKMGSFFPAMALIAVSALVEPDALVEIQAIAYLGHDE
jgi:enamine deaminase RidA (YjgF/YER057c/UK114 family)